jgi:putative ABC transport system substrate-binding protein
MRLQIIGFIVTLAVGILLVPFIAQAQQPAKVYRIGWLHPGLSRPVPHPSLEDFRQGLRERGYVEGQNLIMEVRYAEGKAEQLPDLAAELVRLQVDVMVAGGAAAIRAAQHATRTIPIVMAGTADPVAQGFVASLAAPGGNTTGLSLLNTALPGKRLEILKETVPETKHVAVLVNLTNPTAQELLHNLTVAAQDLRVHLHVVELHRPDEVDSAFVTMTHAGADALIVVADPVLMDGLRARITDLAATSRLPAIYDWRMYVEAGGLMSYGPSLPSIYRQAATYVDKILKGAKPADLPVEQPTTFELVINLKTAKALGLTMPPVVLFQAHEVLQ